MLTRRRLLQAGLILPFGPAIRAGGSPAIIQSAAMRPAIPQGVASGDVSPGQAVIWSRTDRPARMVVEYSTTEAFTDVRRRVGPAALESSDFTARTVLTGLPAGQRIFYRVLFQDLSDLRTWSVPQAGSFQSAPDAAARRDITLAWSADTVGQGWGINTAWGGLRLYEAMRRAEPDVFIHCGDTIYADGPVLAEVTLDDGTVWRNVVTEAKSKVAETLDEYRGNYKYNLLDEHMRRFNADVPQVVLWDDHEVRDNWYETRDLTADGRYSVKSVALLAARARQAFLEFNPVSRNADDPERIHRTLGYGPLLDVFTLDLRSYRGANSPNRQPTLTPESMIFGAAQLASLKSALAASRATWKVIASDMPIGLVVRDGQTNFEAVANGEAGVPLGRELEVADLLKFLRDRRIRNVVWITGDVHYCAAPHSGAPALLVDLIGLPPTPEQVEAFVNNNDPGAYGKLVDSLLADGAGEAWAKFWLDLARYADTAGCEGDPDLPHAWRYRDYVIDSLNRDKPYDEFIREQIAGDEFEEIMGAGELPASKPEKAVALTFLRLAPFTEPRGDVTRHEMLSEMTSTVSSVFLGLTVGCAKCHDHKYDKIPTKDFYRMQAFFDTVQIARPERGDIFQIGGPMPADFYRKGEKEWAEKRRREFSGLQGQLDAMRAEFGKRAGSPVPDEKQDAKQRAGKMDEWISNSGNAAITAEERERFLELKEKLPFVGSASQEAAARGDDAAPLVRASL